MEMDYIFLLQIVKKSIKTPELTEIRITTTDVGNDAIIGTKILDY
jgi:hypothetical protein